MFASLEVCKTSRSALADLLARMYFWTRPSLSRSLAGRHPCWTAACFLPCTRPPDLPRLRLRRPTRRPGPSERDARRAYALTRSGFQTMPTRRDEDEITEDAASTTARGVRAPRFGTRAHATMTPPAPERPLTPDDLQDALGAPTSYGVKLFEINVLQAILTRPVRARLGARDRRHLSTFVITRAGTATGGLHPLCSKLSRHLLPRAADPEGTSFSCFFLCFLVMLSILW